MWASFLVFAVSMMPRGSVFADEIEVSGFAEKLKDVENLKDAEQHASQWCWAASIQAVLAHGGIKRSQQDIVQETYGRVVNLPAYNPMQLYKSLNTIGRDSEGKTQYVASRFYQGSPSAAFLKEEISNNRPVIMWYVNPGGMGGIPLSFSRSITARLMDFP
jgi:peptidase C39-like protein